MLWIKAESGCNESTLDMRQWRCSLSPVPLDDLKDNMLVFQTFSWSFVNLPPFTTSSLLLLLVSFHGGGRHKLHLGVCV